ENATSEPVPPPPITKTSNRSMAEPYRVRWVAWVRGDRDVDPRSAPSRAGTRERGPCAGRGAARGGTPAAGGGAGPVDRLHEAHRRPAAAPRRDLVPRRDAAPRGHRPPGHRASRDRGGAGDRAGSGRRARRVVPAADLHER